MGPQIQAVGRGRGRDSVGAEADPSGQEAGRPRRRTQPTNLAAELGAGLLREVLQ